MKCYEFRGARLSGGGKYRDFEAHGAGAEKEFMGRDAGGRGIVERLRVAIDEKHVPSPRVA